MLYEAYHTLLKDKIVYIIMCPQAISLFYIIRQHYLNPVILVRDIDGPSKQAGEYTYHI